MKKYYLTKSGNILNIPKKCFQTIGGKFLRLASDEEINYLKTVLTPVAFPEGMREPKETPVWQFICRTESKFFHHVANGGVVIEGGYHTTSRDYFFGRNNNGIPEFMVVVVEESDLMWSNIKNSPVRIFDVDIEFFCYEEGGIDEGAEAPLDSYADPCTARDVLYAQGDNLLTFQERVRRYKILKQFGAIVFPSYQRRKRKIPRVSDRFNFVRL